MGESQNGCFKKKHAKFSGKKRTFLTPLPLTPVVTPVRVRIRVQEMFVFFRKIWRALFETPVLRFAFLPYYRRVILLLPDPFFYLLDE